MTIAPPEPSAEGWLGRRRARVVARLEARGTYQRWVLLTALAGMFATTFPVTVLTVSLADIADEFDTAETTIAGVISLPLLLSALALPVLGKLGDLRGHRRVFLIGFALATVTAALTATAWDAPSLIFWRTISQVIGAATQPTSMALIMSVFPARDRVKAMGWWSMVAAGAPAVGLAVGGPLIEALGWPVLFLMQAALSAAALGIALVVLRETPRQPRAPFDVAGSAALALGTGGLMFALTQGNSWGLDHPAVLVSLALAPVGFGLFVWAERRAVAPLLPLWLLARTEFAAPVVASLFTGAAYMGGFFLAPLLLRTDDFGYSLSAISLIMILRPIVYSTSSPVGGHIATRIGERTTAVIGSLVLAGSLALFAAAAAMGAIAVVVAALVLQGLGHGLNRPSISAALANSVDESNLGIAAASERMMFQVGSSFGITVLTVVYGGTGQADDLAAAYLVGAGLGLVTAVACWWIRSTDRSDRHLDVTDETEHAA
ncbi:MAG TPA: MFS transporter [Acidimicrobiales bacterium]|nr:MFS transporter [Acidimicrobiales bacterium]